MLTDAHCHPFDLASEFPQAEEERRRMGVIAAASAAYTDEFAHNEELARRAALDGAAPLLPCFAIHPQCAPMIMRDETSADEQLEFLEKLASEERIAAVGETGFDLFNAQFRETEGVQDRLFAAHLEICLRHDLPVVLHVRRAMHKVFNAAKSLAKCRAVIFHSWQGTQDEGEALLRRGINVYFSFGNVIMLNHKQAMRCCALFPADRLLTETDAPYQPRRGQSYSHWADLPLVIEAAAALRQGVKELEKQIEENFRRAFML
ncbi:MAG: TatD family hydrolase [Treponema sp.]|jgi:TatD DNase family protein|nr:TatD family hydrolase [Treponema sp.]